MNTHHKSPKLAAVIGYPVTHSLSPHIHRIWAAREGASAFYIPVEVGPSFEEFAKACDHLRALGFSGANVTIPHKENALRYCDEVSDNAHIAGAANMVTFTADKACADNSDIFGFEKALAEKLSSNMPRKAALMLGAGGAARGVYLALKNHGFEKIYIANRTKERAVEFVNNLGGEVIDWDARKDAVGKVSVIVNTTSLGMVGAPALDLPLMDAQSKTVICDIVYAPLMTPLLDEAAGKGLEIVNGLAMLMHQAVPGYQAWLGEKAVVDNDLYTNLIDILNTRNKT